jgi:hypothetical protein
LGSGGWPPLMTQAQANARRITGDGEVFDGSVIHGKAPMLSSLPLERGVCIVSTTCATEGVTTVLR